MLVWYFMKCVVKTLLPKLRRSTKKKPEIGRLFHERSHNMYRRPYPLNTVELQKLAARKLRMNAHKTMAVAEALYNKGFISYPRTETTRYNLKDEELKEKIRMHINDPNWGDYAQS